MAPTHSILLSALAASTAFAAPQLGKLDGQLKRLSAVWPSVDYLFTFGDSYTTTGFDVNGQQPNRQNPIGNPAYPGQTQTNAPTYTDYLTTKYNQSFVELYNFAVGGAPIDIEIDPSPFGAFAKSFRQQTYEDFLPNYGDRIDPPWNAKNSLFSVFFGINDIILISNKDNFTDITAALVDSYSQFVDEIYNKGGRRFFFLNVPNISRTPGSGSQPEDKIRYFNAQFQKYFDHFKATKPGVTVFELDMFSLFNEVLDNPASYRVTSGLKNTTDECGPYHQYTDLNKFEPECGVPVNQYFWADGLHPTHVVDKLIAQQMVRKLT